MDLEIRPATDQDWPAIEALLRTCELPPDGARDHLGHFLVAFEQRRLVACGGYEDYGSAILLRSMAVAPERRGSGLGARIARDLLEAAARAGAREAVLLTVTAADYFPRFGFSRIEREKAPEALHASAEFRGACPQSAVVMRLALGSGGD